MLNNITKLFGYAGGTEGTVEPEPFVNECELGTCYDQSGYQRNYYEKAWSREDGWYYTGSCC